MKYKTYGIYFSATIRVHHFCLLDSETRKKQFVTDELFYTFNFNEGVLFNFKKFCLFYIFMKLHNPGINDMPMNILINSHLSRSVNKKEIAYKRVVLSSILNHIKEDIKLFSRASHLSNMFGFIQLHLFKFHNKKTCIISGISNKHGFKQVRKEFCA